MGHATLAFTIGLYIFFPIGSIDNITKDVEISNYMLVDDRVNMDSFKILYSLFVFIFIESFTWRL